MGNRRLWIAARRLTSAFASGSADNLLATVAEIDAAEGWTVVAMALNSDVASPAYEIHGAKTQDWLDERIAAMLDRDRNTGDYDS